MLGISYGLTHESSWQAHVMPSCDRWRNWPLEESNYLPKATQSVSGRTKTRSQVSGIHCADRNKTEWIKSPISKLHPVSTISFFGFIFHLNIGQQTQKWVRIELKFQCDVLTNPVTVSTSNCFFQPGGWCKTVFIYSSSVSPTELAVYCLCSVKLLVTINHPYQTHCYNIICKLARRMTVKQ